MARRKKATKADLDLIKQRGKGISSKIAGEIRDKINNATRRAMVDIMNDLAEKGPRFSGSFADSWRAIPVTDKASGSSDNGQYPYTIDDVPSLPKTVKETQRVVVFTIENTMEYAPIALDLEPGKFREQEFEPIGGVEFGVREGKRTGQIRGEVSAGGGSSISTAELDWYSKYAGGGEINAVIQRVFRFEFKPGGF